MRLRYQLWAWFIPVFCVEAAYGYYLTHIKGYMHGDALSRVANAFYVLHSRDPHLGAIGFVWNPLPSLLELIPISFWNVAPEMVSSGLAAVLASAGFAAGGVTLLYGALRKFGAPLWFACIITLTYAANPFIFSYGANGMSESTFSFFLLWSVIAMTQWLRQRNISSLVQLGAALGMAFWSRYESIAFGIALTLIVTLHWTQSVYRTNASAQPPLVGSELKRKADGYIPRMEAILLIVLLPAVSSGLLWLLLNYMIVGDPLYFLRSGYSNQAFVGQLPQRIADLSGNVLAVMLFVGRNALFFSLPLLAILALRLLSGTMWRKDTVSLLLLSASIPVMQGAMLFTESSFGWLRFFCYPLIIAAAWLPHESALLQGRRFAKWFLAVLCVAMLSSSLIWRDMNDPDFAFEEYEAIHTEESDYAAERRFARAIASWLDSYEGISDRPGELVLTDSISAFFILTQSRNPKQFVITNDRNFNEVLLSPNQHGVQYILVSMLEGSALQAIHRQYPDLFIGGYEWAELIRDFEGVWRLYRVTI